MQLRLSRKQKSEGESVLPLYLLISWYYRYNTAYRPTYSGIRNLIRNSEHNSEPTNSFRYGPTNSVDVEGGVISVAPG